MTIKIYRNGGSLLETWNDYPVIPNVGDSIVVFGKVFSSKVVTRVFSKEEVILRVEG